MASVSAGIKADKPSYSKIAATGLKPPSTQQNQNNANNTQKHEITSPPLDGTSFVPPSNGPISAAAFTPKQKKLVPLTPKDLKESGTVRAGGPQVHVQNVDTVLRVDKVTRAIDGMLMPSALDEAGTQISSSSGSGKPPSLDGKSVTSGTTFALDEKESLRPDDSASVKATEEEESFQPSGPGLPRSCAVSDDGVRAFHDQLREISSMEPPRQTGQPQGFGHVNPAQGVLYVPPPGSGVGVVPSSARHGPSTNEHIEVSPDPKLLEALDSPKDRIMVLKLEQDIVDFVKDPKESSLKLPQTNAFYRMLAHKLADYYMLGHTVDDSNMAVCIFKTPNCRLPPPLTGIATPSTAASTPPPLGTQMKILRRGMGNAGPVIANGSNLPSKTTSENGDSGNDDERRPKVPASREEREARYEAARKRIMGSAKPSDSPEEAVDQNNSRSSSAAGKKNNNNRKKQRDDSDDDFEARSAYSAYYPTPYGSGGPTPPSYGFPTIVDSRNGQSQAPAYNSSDAQGRFSHYGAPASESWPIQSFHAHEASSNWMPNQQSGFDLSADFQRSMSFQPTAMPASMQPNFNPADGQQYNMSHQTWPQHNLYMTGFTSPHEQNYMTGYANRTLPGSNQFQQSQPYQYGQLPSQAFPGRQPSTQEHPLPGSYKSKHFNPQSQSFVPGQANGSNLAPFASQGALSGAATYNSGYGTGTPGTTQRQGYAQARNVSTGSPHQYASIGGPPRAPSQRMTHPLPQPVFPRQPSPNVPLPPKPEATPPKPSDKSYNASPAAVHIPALQNQSITAKWGTPASLPAKPPPSAEPFDPAKFSQAQRLGYPPANMPNFGSMPPMATGYGTSGPGVQSSRHV